MDTRYSRSRLRLASKTVRPMRASVRLLTSMRCSKRIAARSTPNSSTRSSRKLDLTSS